MHVLELSTRPIRVANSFRGDEDDTVKLPHQSSPTKSKQILIEFLDFLGQLQPTMFLQRKPYEAPLTCLETFARWLPLKRGQELIILTSGHQFAKTVEIP